MAFQVHLVRAVQAVNDITGTQVRLKKYKTAGRQNLPPGIFCTLIDCSDPALIRKTENQDSSNMPVYSW